MKKLLVLLFALALSAVFASTAFAATSISKQSTARLVVSGKVTKMKDMPIMVGSKLFMPVKALAVNLGIKDDKKSIIIGKKQVTLVQGKTKLVMTLNSKKATMKGKSVTLDAAPTLYKNVVYLPAEAVAKLYTKKLVWDKATSTIAICSISSFNNVKNLISKFNTAMDSVKYKGTMSVEMNLGNVYTASEQSTIEADGAKKIQHVTTETNSLGMQSQEEKYTTDQYEYTNSSLDGIWTKTAASGDSNVIDLGGGMSDVIYAGLTAKTISDEIVIEGDVELASLFPDAKSDKTYKPHTKLTLDKSKYYVKELKWNSSGTTAENNVKLKYTYTTNATYTDFDSSFEVTLPDELSQIPETEYYLGLTLGISARYPTTWTIDEGSDYTNFVSPDGKSILDISTQDVSLDKPTLQNLAADRIESWYNGGVKLVSSEDITIDGCDAKKLIFDNHIINIIAIKDNIEYMLNYQSENNYDSYLPLFDYMVKSFRFM